MEHDIQTGARTSTVAWALAAAIALLAGVVYAPVFAWMFDNWLTNPYYSHALLLLPIVFYVAWRRRPAFRDAPRVIEASDWAWIALGGLALVWGRVSASNFTQAWSLLPLAVGTLLVTHGRARAKVLLWPLVMLLLVVPLPLLETLFAPLQVLAASAAVLFVRVGGVDAEYGAISLRVNEMEFAVAPLCAGLSTLFSLVATCAVAFLFWPATWKAQGLAYALLVPVALLANAVRIATTVLAATRSGPDAALDFFHGIGAVLLYAVGLAGLVALVWAARRLDARLKKPVPEGVA